MKNEDMKANRFLIWNNAKKRLNAINTAFDSGKDVFVCTNLTQTKYSAKHRDMFKACKSGLYVQRGNKRDCLNFTKIVSR